MKFILLKLPYSDLNKINRDETQFSILSMSEGSRASILFVKPIRINYCSFQRYQTNCCQSFSVSEAVVSTMNWQDELNKYWFMIDEQTKSSLQLIKCDRIRKGFTFDDQFQDEMLCSTNSRYDTFSQN